MIYTHEITEDQARHVKDYLKELSVRIDEVVIDPTIINIEENNEKAPNEVIITITLKNLKPYEYPDNDDSDLE